MYQANAYQMYISQNVPAFTHLTARAALGLQHGPVKVLKNASTRALFDLKVAVCIFSHVENPGVLVLEDVQYHQSIMDCVGEKILTAQVSHDAAHHM
jgi:hypothetical protein